MVWRAGLKDGAAKAQADENARVNLCSGHVSADTRSLFTPTRKPSRPEQSGRLHCDPRALGKGWSGCSRRSLTAPVSSSPSLEMSPRDAGRDPKMRSDLVEGKGMSRERQPRGWRGSSRVLGRGECSG